MRVVFARGKQSTKPDLSAPLTINNCGYYRDISQDAEVCRAGGREDYQIIFVRRGRLTVDDRVYRDGSVYIFTPGERQHYTYKALPKNCYYWLHFSGSKADEFAARYGLGGFYDKSDDAAAMEICFVGNRRVYDEFTAKTAVCRGHAFVGRGAFVLVNRKKLALPTRRNADSRPLAAA